MNTTIVTRRYVLVRYTWIAPTGQKLTGRDWVLASTVARAFDVVEANYYGAFDLQVEKFKDIEERVKE